MFSRVNEPKIIAAYSALLQIGSEQWCREARASIGEEGLLFDGLDSVDGVEGEAEQAVIVDVLLELGRDGLGELDGLATDGRAADGDGVCVDVARGARAIAVGDVPRVAGQLLRAAGGGRVIDPVAVCGGCRELGGEDPAGKGRGGLVK